jgi:hypothetical protein
MKRFVFAIHLVFLTVFIFFFPCVSVAPSFCLLACREAFNAFDTNESGEIDAWELRDILKGLGRNPTDEVSLIPLSFYLRGWVLKELQK